MSDSYADAGASGRQHAGRQHSDIPPELRQLAQSILDRLDPLVGLLAARAQTGGSGKCEQVWCPVCALAALIAGEEHPLLNVVAEHSVGLLALVKAMLDNLDSKPPQPHAPTPESPSESASTASPEPGHYQHITVVIKDSADSAE